MNIIVFNADSLKPAEFNTWRTKKVEIEIAKALEETGNNVSFINFDHLKRFYQDLRKIKCNESIVLALSGYVDDNRDIFVSNVLEELRIPFVGSGSSGFNKVGWLIRTLNVPTLVVQEGGYCVPDLGRNVAAFLKGLGDFRQPD